MSENFITIFTPTFNRAYTLPKLYESLTKQTSKDFTWLIIDDGSTDNTQELVKGWIKKNNITIIYYKQPNQGKSLAHNKGVNMTRTELFTCVDSDDYLNNCAVEEIIKAWRNNKENPNIIGVLAYKENVKDDHIVMYINESIVSTTLRDGYRKHDLKGDMMLIYRTNILNKYAFPKIEGEKFVPEAYLYDLLDQNGELVVLNKTLYYYEYLNDGYTNSMAKLLAHNPKGYIAYIKQRLYFDNNMKDKILDLIRYISMCISSGERVDFKVINPTVILFCYPMGYILYLKKFKKYKKLK